MIDETLMKTLSDTVRNLHRSKVESLVDKLMKMDSNEMSSVDMAQVSKSVDKKVLQSLKTAAVSSGIGPKELALALRVGTSMMHMSDQEERIELVWSGPATNLVPSRRTEQVMVETILAAKESVFLLSYVFYGVDPVTKAIEQVVGRGIRVEVLLESCIEKGGKVDVDSHAKMKRVLPNVHLYAAVIDDDFDGTVHAKCILADDHTLFVTSANLTKAAMDRNMELGVKISGGENPKKLKEHLKLLKASGRIERI